MNESGFSPTGDLVLVKPLAVDEKTKGGIVLSKVTMDAEGMASRCGHVVDMGSIARQHPRMEGINPGDMVLFARYAGDFFPTKGQKFFILRVDSILGKTTVAPDYALNAALPQAAVFGANESPDAPAKTKLVMPT